MARIPDGEELASGAAGVAKEVPAAAPPQIFHIGIIGVLGCVLGIRCREQRTDVGHALVDLILVHFDRALPYSQIVSKRLWIIELQPVVGHQFPCFRHIASAARQLKVINID